MLTIEQLLEQIKQISEEIVEETKELEKNITKVSEWLEEVNS